MRQAQEVEDSQQFYQELEEEELATLKKHNRGRKGARGSKSNSNVETLHKQALFDSFFGRFQQASKKLKHVIMLNPDNPEPYHILGTMHGQNGQLDKAAQYLFMSTYLSPPNLQKWLKVGELSFERKMFNQAAYCFGRALKIAPCDPKIMIRRAEAFELAGQFKKAITTYKRLLTISNSPEYTKKYAKLRYKKGEYSHCRQILQSIQNYIADTTLVFMLCQTHLQEHQYQKAATLLQKHLDYRSQSMHEEEQLVPEFIVVLLICAVTLKRECYGFSAEILIESAKKCYEEEYSQLYAQALGHISKFSEEYSCNLTLFLLDYTEHQTLSNYISAIDYLCKQKNRLCLNLLETALKMNPSSPQLLALRDYVNKSFGIGGTMRKVDDDQIFHSDEDEEISFVHIPHIPQTKKMHETADSQVMQKLLYNVEQALELLMGQINNGSLPGNKEQETILDGIQLFISLSPGSKDEQFQEKDGLYMKKTAKKRANDGQSKKNIINEHISIVIKYFQNLVLYLQGLLSHKQWKKLIQIGQKVSKVHVFKNHSKNTDFVSIKIKIYEMCVLSCLAVNKFNTGLFFLRFLVTKHPQDSLYALALHLLLRICPKKTFITSALNRRINNPGGEKLARLLAIEYMETGCFQLAVGAFLRSSHNQEALGPTPQLCIAACLIQIASSRNTFNKLDFTNRSALCLASYQGIYEQKWQMIFNRGRWYSQVKLNQKSIPCYEQILAGDADIKIKQRAAFCLISIYRDCDQFAKANKLSRIYFPIPEAQMEVQQNADKNGI